MDYFNLIFHSFPNCYVYVCVSCEIILTFEMKWMIVVNLWRSCSQGTQPCHEMMEMAYVAEVLQNVPHRSGEAGLLQGFCHANSIFWHWHWQNCS